MIDIQSKMSQLAARFAARAVEERKAFAASLASGDRASVAERAHRLAGIAGMCGHPQITEAALALEAAAEEGRAMDAEGRCLLEQLAAIEPG